VGIAILAGSECLTAAEQPDPQNRDPEFLHGAGQVIGGVFFEFPKTVIDATLTGPPVVGTLVGILAGTARALQVTAAGVAEMARGFNPWGGKRPRPTTRSRKRR
jgi:hypothetical protein